MTNARPDDDLPRTEIPDADQSQAPGPNDTDDNFEIEHDGQVYALPGALKGGFMRRADYTRKTQELAAYRRALEAEREAAAAHARAAHGALGDHAHLAALDRQLASFDAVDWRSLSHADPQRAQALWSQAQQTIALRERYAAAVAHDAQHRRIEAAQAAAARMAATGQALQREIDGWSPELAAKLVDYARGHGVTLDELGAADDPRVWKILHCAYQGDSAKRQDDNAASASRAQAVRPAITVSGSAPAGGGMRDELATKEWMKRRNDIVRKAR